MNTNDPNAFLMGGGVKSAQFPTIGTMVTGRIHATPEVRQQIDPQDNTPKTFANGDPMMQLVVQLITDQRDPQVTDDDGVRGLYIKANMLNAVRDAVRKSGANGLEIGGTLTVTYVGDGEKKKAAFNAPKLYAAAYQPPTAVAANSMLMGGGNGHAQPPTQPADAAPAPVAAQPAPVGEPPAGVDPNLWAQMSPEQRGSILSAMTNVR